MSLAEELRGILKDRAEINEASQIAAAERAWHEEIVPQLRAAVEIGRRGIYFHWSGLDPQPHYFQYESRGKLLAFEKRIFELARGEELRVTVINAPRGGRCLSIGV